MLRTDYILAVFLCAGVRNRICSDSARLGLLMDASHDSLRDDFQVSNEALDTMVGIARAEPGCFGARMTGGGFGGCTVSLVLARESSAIAQHLQNTYREETGIEAEIFVVAPSDGALSHLGSLQLGVERDRP